MHRASCDVIIVGGGPSGLHAASELSEYGCETVLFEQDSEIGEGVVCSGVISAEAFRRFDLPKETVAARLQEAELISPGGISISYSHPEEAAVVVDRHAFDARLADIARDRGASICLGAKVLSLHPTADRVEARVQTEYGISTIHARIAVLATGVSFNLQSALGLGRPKKIIKGIQVDVKFNEADRLKIYFGNGSSRGFFGWAIPLLDGRTRIGVMTTGDASEELKNTIAKVSPWIDADLELSRAMRRGIAFGAIRRSYADRIIAIGEAAGHIKTTTGGGIYYGLITAQIASDVIRKALAKGSLDARALSEYERIWQKSVGREVRFGEYFHRFYSKLDDPYIDKLFHAAKTDGLFSFIAERGKFDWHKDAVVKILRSPNLRGVLFSGFLARVTS
ncbi:MAG: NAD(P)/FAD-dependent oxidoreductase [Deltaproteobacteria bacterium]